MPHVRTLIGLIGVTVAAACGGGTTTAPDPFTPPVISTPDFETYSRDDNGFARVRQDLSEPGDSAVLAQFEDANPADPAGYRNLIALSDQAYAGKMVIEVIGEVETTGGSETVKRILRLTADQILFNNLQGGSPIAATGKYFLRGQNFAWVSINDGPIRSGADSTGLVDLVLDFGAETASLNLRTGVNGTSAIRTEVSAQGLPFNVRSGAYGGDVTVQIWDPDSTTIFEIDGSLRGNIGGSPAFANNMHGMTTSGLYTANGRDGGATVEVNGVFFGMDPNALP